MKSGETFEYTIRYSVSSTSKLEFESPKIVFPLPDGVEFVDLVDSEISEGSFDKDKNTVTFTFLDDPLP
ncbi:hypothetical protein, partial [Brevibacillus borstelensis]